jgi:hypothetical protein
VPKPDVAHAVKWNGHWYAFYPDLVHWDDAIRISEEQGGHLLCIESAEENKFIAELVYKKTGHGEQSIKIGAVSHKGEWKWINGKSVSKYYSNWDKGTAPPYDSEKPIAIMIQRNKDGKIVFDKWISHRKPPNFPFVIEWD